MGNAYKWDDRVVSMHYLWIVFNLSVVGKAALIIPVSWAVISAVGKKRKKKKKKKKKNVKCQKQLFPFPTTVLAMLENDSAKGKA